MAATAAQLEIVAALRARGFTIPPEAEPTRPGDYTGLVIAIRAQGRPKRDEDLDLDGDGDRLPDDLQLSDSRATREAVGRFAAKGVTVSDAELDAIENVLRHRNPHER